MFCIHCGGQLPDDARFCPSCGKKVSGHPSAAPAQAAKSLFRPGVCSACGSNQLKELRRGQNTLFILGGGVITFGVWSVVKMIPNPLPCHMGKIS